ncbi:hypothetical protein [Stakelama saccharophila]|uniref:PIN domain-containing protein n=1 Tax=Stakelama saccharophila TaxID=3075605 RepID=A0ABZ0BBU3_9SPHN|nr:hypothetical protein [Stakelama sp. W311]WNO54116.1 hypothetical protein RPR59_02315 [Stakelama sp. W311]
MPHLPMNSRLDTSGYDRVFALDTQMIFEARPLTQLDWSMISNGPILLLVVPQASAEVDARKRDGRLGQRARDLNRLLEPSIESGGTAMLAGKPVRIDIAYVAAGRIDWDQLEDLERDNGDDRIVAQAVHALVDDPARIEVMSFDSRPRAAARRHGMKAIKPDESWLLAPEPSPTDRRAVELEQRVRMLQASEPQLRVGIRMLHELPLVRFRVPPLPAETIDPVTRMILAKHPREYTGGFMAHGLHINSNYDEDYDDYAAALSAVDVPNIHLGVARQFSQYGFEVSIENVGVLAAEHVTVELRSGNAVLHDGPYVVDIFGPPPPSTQSDFLTNIPRLSHNLARTDRTSFDVEESEVHDVQVEYRCQDFRHGRLQTLTAAIELVERTGEAAHVEVRVTAGNMRGDVIERLIVPVTDQERRLGELIDLDNLQLREAPPIREFLLPLLQGDDSDEIERFRNDGSRRE